MNDKDYFLVVFLCFLYHLSSINSIMERMKNIVLIGPDNLLAPENYYDVITACHANYMTLDIGEPIEKLKDADGIILPGGVDVNPKLYHEENKGSRYINDELDEMEMKTINYALKHHIPMFGTCRGMQILNIYFGGTMNQDISTKDIHSAYSEKGRWYDRRHDTLVTKDSFIHKVYGSRFISVNSAHHQGLKQLGWGFKTVQISDDDLIEGIEHDSLPIIAVQWHPERMALSLRRDDTVDGLPLFDYFINTYIDEFSK